MLNIQFFFALTHNDRNYVHLAFTVSPDVPFAGVLTFANRKSESGSKFF